MNRDYLELLVNFHYWARDRVLVAVDALTGEQYERPMGNSFPAIRDTLNHLYQAEWIWYSRWNGVSPTAFPEPPSDRAGLRTRWAALESDVRAYLERAGDDGLNRVIAYRLLSGTESAAPLWQLVAHLVNHGTYHRGQVATMLRQLNATPAASTDMITYFRELAA